MLRMFSFIIAILFCFGCLGLQAQQYQDYVGDGHQLGVTVTSSSNHESAVGFNTINGVGKLPDEAAASRFLAQATLGSNATAIENLTLSNYSQWLEDQFNEPQFGLLNHMDNVLIPAALQAHLDRGEPEEDFGPWGFFHLVWWEATMTGNDVLRDKVALALSEIFVISEKSDLADYPEGLCDYYDLLSENAFGNFRDLLFDVTMHPTMGNYLSHLDNPKADFLANIYPDENYAREIMQLFSIGLYELNNDGTHKLDAQGNSIPTYDNQVIGEFAKIFTGLGAEDWSRHAEGPAAMYGWGPVDFGVGVWGTDLTQPMKMYEEWHQLGVKYLLNGAVVPAGQSGMDDINDAIDNLFNHPNVGPFIGRRLIQRMVKSNPSAAYINRVANAFNDNGQGIRGDMKSVIRAILLDPEARDCSWIPVSVGGMLREPIQRYTHMLRALNSGNAHGHYYQYAWYFNEEQRQLPLSSPSVFNFFLPDYQPLGPVADLGLVAPEFQIFNSASSIGYVNLVHAVTLWDYVYDDYRGLELDPDNLPDSWFSGLDMSYEESLITSQIESVLEDEIDVLLDYLDVLLTHGQLSDGTRQIIHELAIETTTDPYWIVRFCLYGILISPDYAILK